MLDFIKYSWADNNKQLDAALTKLLDEKGFSINYLDLFKLQLDTVVNPYLPEGQLDTDKILVYVPPAIDPILVFVVGVARPYGDYWIDKTYTDIYRTYVQYGSCSVCDTLKHLFDICGDTDKLVKGLKSVCLHILEHMEQIQVIL